MFRSRLLSSEEEKNNGSTQNLDDGEKFISRLENVLSAPLFEQEKLRPKIKKLDRLFINIEPFVGYDF